MAYTPINWAENLEVNATKLDKMDNQINANENDISNHEGRVTTNESDINNIETFSAGTNYIYQNNSATTFSFSVQIYKSGSVKVYFQFRSDTDYSSLGRYSLKKNGTTIQSETTHSNRFSTITINVSISINDIITLELGGRGEAKNFRIGIEGPADVIRTI